MRATFVLKSLLVFKSFFNEHTCIISANTHLSAKYNPFIFTTSSCTLLLATHVVVNVSFISRRLSLNTVLNIAVWKGASIYLWVRNYGLSSNYTENKDERHAPVHGYCACSEWQAHPQMLEACWPYAADNMDRCWCDRQARWIITTRADISFIINISYLFNTNSKLNVIHWINHYLLLFIWML